MSRCPSLSGKPHKVFRALFGGPLFVDSPSGAPSPRVAVSSFKMTSQKRDLPLRRVAIDKWEYLVWQLFLSWWVSLEGDASAPLEVGPPLGVSLVLP